VDVNSWHIPAHVPAHLVVDFDFFNPPGGDQDIHLAWHRLHDFAPDIFWTPRNGGHWIATRADDIDIMQLDHERFSHGQFMLPVIELPYPPLPLNLDPPDHTEFRKLLAPAFSPKSVSLLTEIARANAVTRIDQLVPLGRCEFVGDFAKVMPIVVFLGMVGLPEEDRETLLPWADTMVRSAHPAARYEASQNIADYLKRHVDERLRNPGDDLISRIAHAKIRGRALSVPEILGMCSVLLTGGLDTVAGMLAFTARYLAEHPERCAELSEDRSLIPVAVEEIMRRHALPNTARLITQDFDYKQIPFKRGDMIQLPKVLYNLDDRRITNPLQVDLRRPKPVPNATFGSGPHRCPGALLARSEIRIFIEEWLERIPRFRLKPGFHAPTIGGMVNGLRELQLIWH
jgi:cytochrome P450